MSTDSGDNVVFGHVQRASEIRQFNSKEKKKREEIPIEEYPRGSLDSIGSSDWASSLGVFAS